MRLLRTIVNITPNLGYETNEPSLKETVDSYYQRHFDNEKAKKLSVDYFITLEKLLVQEGIM